MIMTAQTAGMGDGAQSCFTSIAASATEALELARWQRDRQQAAGQGCAREQDGAGAAGEEMLWRAVAVDALAAIRAVVQRNGPGRYHCGDLALLAGRDRRLVQRVLNEAIAAGLAPAPAGQERFLTGGPANIDDWARGQ